MWRCMKCVSASSGTPQAGSADATKHVDFITKLPEFAYSSTLDTFALGPTKIMRCPVPDLPEQTHGIKAQSQPHVICMLCLGDKMWLLTLLDVMACRPLETALECRTVEKEAAVAELQAAAAINATRQAQVCLMCCTSAAHSACKQLSRLAHESSTG